MRPTDPDQAGSPVVDRSTDPDEFAWEDADRCHGRVIGHREVRLEQGDVPADVAALVEVGEPMRNGVINANPVYVTADEAVEIALVLLDAAARTRAESDPYGPPKGPVEHDDHDRRWKLHAHACSIEDMTFWIERTSGGWKATEVETGVTGAEAPTPSEAVANYFDGKLWGDR